MLEGELTVTLRNYQVALLLGTRTLRTTPRLQADQTAQIQLLTTRTR